MILQALRQLAIAENLIPDPDFEYKSVSWRVSLGEDGTLVGIEDLRRNVNEGTNRKPRYEGKQILVPRQPIRTSGDLAFFLVDKAEYVFGIDPAGKRPPNELQLRAALFREQVEQCAEASRDPAVVAVADFLKRVAEDPSQIGSRLRQAQPSTSDLFAFRVGLGEDFVHLRPAVRAFWQRQRRAQPPGAEAFQCLVTGELVSEVGLFPLIRRIPGGTPSGVALVSYNVPAFESYGLRRNENAPISRTAAEQAATALNRLLHPAYPNPAEPGTTLRPRRVKLSKDTVFCFWASNLTREAASFLDRLPDLFQGENEDKVGESYRSIWRGRAVEIKDPSAFYVLTISGSQGRAIVRDWLETTLEQAARNLANHFQDLEVVRHARPRKGRPRSPAVPLQWLMRSLAAEGRAEPVPACLAAAFVRSAFNGLPYPFELLQRALVRARVEAGGHDWADAARRDARAALLKAVLNRRRRFHPQAAQRYQEVTSDMNPNHDSPGYALGLLMAVLERLQVVALGDIKASVVDRYFSAASATPRTVFVRLLKNAQHHARKARESDDRGARAAAFRCNRMIDHIAERFDVDPKRYPPRSTGLPAHLDLEQQGLFVLGYHQMRHWLWMTNEERAAWEAAHPDAPRPFRWLKEPEEEAPEPELLAS
ncbi:MAG: type I-C CRISPR-associated protein Cas8c/Csd1 [Thermoguttaceae bacterium]